jgi:hypothetical protein
MLALQSIAFWSSSFPDRHGAKGGVVAILSLARRQRAASQSRPSTSIIFWTAQGGGRRSIAAFGRPSRMSIRERVGERSHRRLEQDSRR